MVVAATCCSACRGARRLVRPAAARAVPYLQPNAAQPSGSGSAVSQSTLRLYAQQAAYERIQAADANLTNLMDSTQCTGFVQNAYSQELLACTDAEDGCNGAAGTGAA